jgi:phenylpyruvate tautomerase PptA (4-oxalocrotonate tautomerase family)
MPMIDVYAVRGTFADKPALIRDLTAALMRWERVPLIPQFRDNTAAYVHDLEPDATATASGRTGNVRIQVLTPAGVLDREKKLGVTKELTDIVAAAAGDPELTARTWVLVTEAPDGGWGIGGHAYTSAEIGEAARRALAER